ncbi:signal transduction protein [Cellvibrio sp. BR]|jgi:HD-like signal output (HDOD) protein|uniref:HDOD domain-containing protein n=1 Tax=unclassified Cellvibrio TaxID=2624793 RepID=UPI00026010B1|nr:MULTISPECIES: HDOD domain-containing protein [unclassified Cellvibrio]EIK46616.1 signal transduction protein [Cellvibrio sp. BR]UUA71485.1 HDOD domain-containing protein [Cellvibrio sp. QJXJ]
MINPQGLQEWMDTLAEQELPTLNAVVREICELSENEKCRAEDLTKIILRDADLTSKVLKIANSVHYNPAFASIKTVSRAIVHLGFDNLRNITLATTLIENFLQGKPKALLIQSLARSFHAAVQAKAMVPFLDGDKKEQIFIAALLRNISELALISTGLPVVAEFIEARDREPQAEHSLALEYLGVDTSLLSRHLIKDWTLGDLLSEACENHVHSSAAARAVNLGNQIATYIQRGIKSPEMHKLCQQTASLCKLPLEDAQQQILLMADEASVIAKIYGVDMLISALPDPDDIDAKEQPSSDVADYLFQQRLNQIHKAMMAGDSLPKVTQLSLAALHEGAAIARVAILFVDHKTKQLDVRYVAGKGTHLWRQQVKINLEQLHKGELLHEFLRQQEPYWYQPKVALKDMGALQVMGATGGLFLAPLQLNKRLLAIAYADGERSGLNARQFEEFQLIANQLNLMMRLNAGTQ